MQFCGDRCRPFDDHLTGRYLAAMSRKNLGEIALLLSPHDNVAVLRCPLQKGDELVSPLFQVTVERDVPRAHKIALTDLAEGDAVIKYGHCIGVASKAIRAGEHVHTHNLRLPNIRPSSEGARQSLGPFSFAEKNRYFPGYARPDGRVGTRNYVGVISSVNCSASVCRQVRDAFRSDELKRDFPGVDGVVALTHEGGCGSDPGEPQRLLQRVLLGMLRHPNIYGCVVVGLGCELNHIEGLQGGCASELPAGQVVSPVFLNIQSVGGTRKTVQAATAALLKLLSEANELKRTPQPVSSLVLAENCGGSDASSGLTANPALGVASDELVRHGGTSVLAETPEIYGAEHLLMERASSPAIAEALLERIHWWEGYVQRHNSSLDNNPSPGNKAGGLSNIIEKSLGAVAKSGTAPLNAVYGYAEPITSKGLCFMDTPGYDPVSMTGLVAGGCNIGIFTTGRGSVYGCKPVPCIKVASNTELFLRMEDDMDINAGPILDGTASTQGIGQLLFEKLLAVAGGEKTRSELAGMGDEEFVPWRLGPTL